ncbi:MAG: DUF3996 domain-containing protein [Deltaproteobacteria bacterium]|nr:DUF3996 domain-containing protein [Deltaproteobacteria bacterium]
MRVHAMGLMLVSLTSGAAGATAPAPSALLQLDTRLIDDVATVVGAPLADAGTGMTVADGTGPASSSGTTLAAAGAASTPQGRQFGIGLELGYPVALTIKYMLKPDQGIAAGLGVFSGFVYNHSSVTIYVDYVYHPHLLTTGEAFALTWYLGGGAQVIINDRFSTPWVPGIMYSGWGYGSVWFAARVPIGVSLTLAQAPLEVFLEAAPSVLVFPVLSFGVGGAIGMRFYL